MIRFFETYAEQLGSDCPFFINNQPAYATGTRIELETFELDLSGLWMILINPGIHVSTANAYAGVTPQAATKDLIEILQSKNYTRWKSELINDFEQSIFKKAPSEIEKIKNYLYEQMLFMLP